MTLSTSGPRFGAHMSTAGGLHVAFEHADAAGCDSLQIFVKNQRQWQARPLDPEIIAAWRRAARARDLGPLVAHASYLVNLASADAALHRRSVSALVDELTRSQQLGIKYVVFHPGAHLASSLTTAIRRIARGIDEIHRRTEGLQARLLLETTAGQGTAVGHRFEHLRDIIGATCQPRRLGVCIDTCHIFAAGYDIRTQQSYDDTMSEFDRIVGLRRVKCFHVNDSKRELGSRVDRHDHIGGGCIGLAGFGPLVRDPRWYGIPMILETPKGQTPAGTDHDVANLRRLRRLQHG
jgi:deoxyribonuclease-4